MIGPYGFIHSGAPLSPLILMFGTLCAFVMGIAIQRGSTCLVAAFDELLSVGQATRLLAIAEASLWVTGGLLLARAAGDMVSVPHPSTTTALAIVGGSLFGIGACAFGTVARFGSGEWAYAFTPLGIFVGDLSLRHVLAMMAASAPEDSLILAIGSWVLVPITMLIIWRVVGFGRSLASADSISRPWSAHAATAVIGVTFLAMFLTIGPWAYTDLLSDIARGAVDLGDVRCVLIGALLLGAVSAGWQGGRLQFRAPVGRAVFRCWAGGLLMGWGSALIPGGNDGLLLIGVPLLRSYAWVAGLAMGATIVGALSLSRLIRPIGSNS